MAFAVRTTPLTGGLKFKKYKIGFVILFFKITSELVQCRLKTEYRFFIYVLCISTLYQHAGLTVCKSGNRDKNTYRIIIAACIYNYLEVYQIIIFFKITMIIKKIQNVYFR